MHVYALCGSVLLSQCFDYLQCICFSFFLAFHLYSVHRTRTSQQLYSKSRRQCKKRLRDLRRTHPGLIIRNTSCNNTYPPPFPSSQSQFCLLTFALEMEEAIWSSLWCAAQCMASKQRSLVGLCPSLAQTRDNSNTCGTMNMYYIQAQVNGNIIRDIALSAQPQPTHLWQHLGSQSYQNTKTTFIGYRTVHPA